MEGQEAQTFTIILDGNNTKDHIEMDTRFLDYELQIFNKNLITKDEPVHLPKQINPRVFQVIKEFIKLQNYHPAPVIKGKPITSSKYEQQVTDPKYYEFFKEYTNLANSERATELLEFADYIKFDIFYDAIGAAIAVNYYVGNTEDDIKKFMEENRLEKLTPSQISQIMDEHPDIFERIEEKSKAQMVNGDM